MIDACRPGKPFFSCLGAKACPASKIPHLSGELYKSEILLNDYSLIHCLWWKPKPYIGTQEKCAKRWKQSSAFKQYLETLLVAIKMCTGFTTDVIWANTKEGSVTSDSNQSSSRRVSSLRDSSVLFNIWGVNFITVMSFYMLAVSQIRNHFKLE